MGNTQSCVHLPQHPREIGGEACKVVQTAGAATVTATAALSCILLCLSWLVITGLWFGEL